MSSRPHSLLERIAARTARIGVVGLGYVGLPTAVAYASAGFHVVGIDTNINRLDAIRAGVSHIPDIPDEILGRHIRSGLFQTASILDPSQHLDVVEICVPTPLNKSLEPDVSAIVYVVRTIAGALKVGQLILLVSTTYPGTTRELVLPELEAVGLRVGTDFFLAFAPERIDPGNTSFGFGDVPRIVGGITPKCTEAAAALLNTVVKQVVTVTDATTAEMTKILENTFRAVNIGLANETAIICHKLGIDVWEVVNSAATKPFGFMPFYPGPGLGGHCIPVDPSYLAWKMRRLNYTTRFIELANDLNRHMPEYVLSRIAQTLNARRKSLNGSRILLLGMAYKRNVGDIRESPAIDIYTLLRSNGCLVKYCDPHVANMSLEDTGLILAAPLTPQLLKNQDLVVVTTDHDQFDWKMITDYAPEVLDTRGTVHGRLHSAWHRL